MEYYNKQWKKYNNNNMLNYYHLPTEVCTNSYLENYNRILKLT